MLTRRAFLGGLCLLAVGAARASVLRVAALDWVSGQNLMALGLEPIAMPELERYAELVVEPLPSAAVRELGLRSEPNLELLDRLRPDLLLVSPELESVRGKLDKIAPIMSFEPHGFKGGDIDRINHGRQALAELARTAGLGTAFSAYEAGFAEEIATAARRLTAYDGRPLYCLTFIDSRRALVYGRNSLFQDVLDRLGIANAYSGPLSAYGHATVTIDRLAANPDARVLSIGNRKFVSMSSIAATPFVARLPFMREGRIALIDPVLFYGGMPSALRFARLASRALSAGNEP